MTRFAMIATSMLAAGVAMAQPVTQTLKAQKVKVYLTAAGTADRLQQKEDLVFKPLAQPAEAQACIFVDQSQQFQTILGIGGAITDASAETFAKLPAHVQRDILTNYFDPVKGIGYTLVRTTIQSCDFSTGSYSYVSDFDKSLKSFSVSHDEKFRIPLLQAAIHAAGDKLTVFASPWSPPAWM